MVRPNVYAANELLLLDSKTKNLILLPLEIEVLMRSNFEFLVHLFQFYFKVKLVVYRI